MSTDDDFSLKRREELRRLMSEVNSEAKLKESQGQEIIRAARQTQDMNAPLLDLVNGMPVEFLAAPEWDQPLTVMREWLGVATNDALTFPTMVSTFGAVTAAVANTCTNLLYTVSSQAEAAGVKLEAISIAEARLGEVIRPEEVLPKVRSSMSRLGLDSQRTASRPSPLKLLEDAYKSLTLGEGPEAVLLTLRSCLDRCLDMLLKRRSEQEKAPRKIEALGSSCGRTALSAEFFADREQEYGRLYDRLSSAKGAAMSRDRIVELFNQGLTFLDALLGSIDEGRLKPPKT